MNESNSLFDYHYIPPHNIALFRCYRQEKVDICQCDVTCTFIITAIQFLSLCNISFWIKWGPFGNGSNWNWKNGIQVWLLNFDRFFTFVFWFYLPMISIQHEKRGAVNMQYVYLCIYLKNISNLINNDAQKVIHWMTRKNIKHFSLTYKLMCGWIDVTHYMHFGFQSVDMCLTSGWYIHRNEVGFSLKSHFNVIRKDMRWKVIQTYSFYIAGVYKGNARGIKMNAELQSLQLQ